MQFTVEIQAHHLTAIMQAIRSELSTPAGLLENVGEHLLNTNQERHDRGVDPDGRPWKELAPSTLAAGARKGGPLNKTGRMLRSLHYQVQGDVLKLGFDDGDGFKAKFHQDGSKPHEIRPKVAKALHFGGRFVRRVNHPGLPARTLLGFPLSDQSLVGDVVADHLDIVMKRIR